MNEKSNTTTVAQAISFAIDEVQEYGTADGEMGLFLDRDVDRSPEQDLRVVEVGAELIHGEHGRESFTVTTSDGKTFIVTVEEASYGGAYGTNPETGQKILAWMDSKGNPQG